MPGQQTAPDQKVRQTIVVYVESDSHDARTLSFDRPDDISAKDALEAGLAVEGMAYVLPVTADMGSGNDVDFGQPFGSAHDEPYSLYQNLHEAELGLAEWLEKRGYEVRFA